MDEPSQTLDWAQAPEGTTHVYLRPGAELIWLKLGSPGELEHWRRPGGRNWRPGFDYSGKWLRHSQVQARPAT